MVHPDAEKWRDDEEVYRWYTKEIASIPPPMRELLEKYSGIPAERVIPHISELVSVGFSTSTPWPPILGIANRILAQRDTSHTYRESSA